MARGVNARWSCGGLTVALSKLDGGGLLLRIYQS